MAKSERDRWQPRGIVGGAAMVVNPRTGAAATVIGNLKIGDGDREPDLTAEIAVLHAAPSVTPEPPRETR